ncbi:hypothetical protein FIU97_03995 [Roseivivax sp. THAF40]|uniref:oxalurate catabolism protein HpxZ n=1 Tax=unclassified Roseivivax TaxID=2639302 RepID=UPI0012690B8F|nr:MULTISPECIES: oxalurate catabolism protein HpxZ [unclassified Roseivivax]QFS81931.1 hypothetical protein FIV09_03735 [Roseivivax sp. THAF197b]QFT45731.1 hypothetical protein FIU97_03995 [Roseivivax sp. THAF40]
MTDDPQTAPGLPQTEVNRPEILAEVQAVFDTYEEALVSNDIPVLQRLFWDSAHTIRLGATENLYGTEEIEAFRKARPGKGLMRTLTRVEIRTYGRDFATTHAEFTRDGEPKIGRQTQTLVRFPEIGWRIVSAHVSKMS